MSPTITCVTALLLLGTVSAGRDYIFKSSVNDKDRHRCHDGIRDVPQRCFEYVNYHKPHKRQKRDDHEERPPPPPPPPEMEIDREMFPELAANCTSITWQEANRTNNWGNCMEMTTDATHRYISSNTVPDFYYNPYCPIGLGYGYCIDLEYELGRCMFPNLTCGDYETLGPGAGPLGDYWVAQEAFYKIPLAGNPTRPDRPGDMYDAETVGALKSVGPTLAVAINGLPIFGPNDAGDISIDEAGFQLACGGHVTPPLSLIDPSIFPMGAPPPSPPFYHYHKAPDCLEPFTEDYKGVSRGARPFEHGKLTGWAMDGFGVYTYQDVGGLTPIVDECGGHFGPVTDDEDAEVVYHYHSRVFVPYTIACQGPALGRCEDTQGVTNYCHYGCGAEVCVQPGTSETKLREYLAEWDDGWLDQYTTNAFKEDDSDGSDSMDQYEEWSGAGQTSLVLTYCLALLQLARLW